jgi:hypothetical protein
LTNRNPVGDNYLQWFLIRQPSGAYAVKSISSGGGFLDGRNPEHVGGPNLFLTNRNPAGDKYLHWIVLRIDGHYAFKSVSSGEFGRKKP